MKKKKTKKWYRKNERKTISRRRIIAYDYTYLS